MKPTPRTPTPKEIEVDEKLKNTHDKHVYSFTTEELARLRNAEDMLEFLNSVYTLKANKTIVNAAARVGHTMTPDHQVTYNTSEKTFIVYVPKSV